MRGTVLWLGPAVAIAVAVVIWFSAARRADRGGPVVAVVVPDLAGEAGEGARVFAENCVACHGTHAAGTEIGPPLVHKYYRPAHHGDGSFRIAVANGVRAHHWGFGDMPPQPQLTMAEAEKVIAYIRALQRANGIF